MRKIEWEVQVDPMTFQPVCVCLVEGEITDVRYTLELVQDLTAQYGKEQYICDIKAVLDENFRNTTDLTVEERIFALGDGFKPKPFKWQHNE